MRATRRALGAFLAVAILLATGCSGSGGDRSSATTTTTSSLSSGPYNTEPAPVVADFAPCRTRLDPSVRDQNEGIHGLGRRLVPIDATRLRVCRYDGQSERLTGTGLLGSPPARQVAIETNALAPTLRYTGPGRDTCLASGPVYTLTFTDDETQVNVIVVGCLAALNGDRLGRPTTRWFNELQHYTIATHPRLKPTGTTGGLVRRRSSE
jgi:hypothetical protein